MHTFNFSEAISGGLKAFGKKALPLILITLVGGILSVGVQFLFMGGSMMQSSMQGSESRYANEVESSFGNLMNVIENAENYDNEEEMSRDIAESFGMNYDDVMEITEDGEVSNMEALSVYNSSTMNPFGEVSFGKLALGFLLSVIIGAIFGIALATAALDAVFDRKFAVENITKNFSRLPSLILFAILMGLLSLINIIPLLGFIIYMVVYYMVIQAPFVILEEKKGAIDAIKRSNELMKGNKLRMFGLTIVIAIVGAILSVVTLGIGMLVVAPAVACIMAHIYKQLTQGPVATAAKKVKEAVS